MNNQKDLLQQAIDKIGFYSVNGTKNNDEQIELINALSFINQNRDLLISKQNLQQQNTAQPKQDWEIVDSYRDEDKRNIITSVKYKDEIYSVGETIIDNSSEGIIREFSINGNELNVLVGMFWRGIEKIKKLKPTNMENYKWEDHCFFTNIDMMINYLKSGVNINGDEGLIKLLEETKKNGYTLVKMDKVEDRSNEICYGEQISKLKADVKEILSDMMNHNSTSFCNAEDRHINNSKIKSKINNL